MHDDLLCFSFWHHGKQGNLSWKKFWNFIIRFLWEPCLPRLRCERRRNRSGLLATGRLHWNIIILLSSIAVSDDNDTYPLDIDAQSTKMCPSQDVTSFNTYAYLQYVQAKSYAISSDPHQLQFIELHHFKLDTFKSIQLYPGN